ncbi:MAG: CRISPR-associated endonuclease Cas1 [Spirochaetia bacterium]|nr:CRISPR-associated endonuclease Cas1 [Spirochaetota bacterium]MDW8113294.1 CRISPR-associated endonuclease Cas1 [Spirochaetia bacterium]
MRKYPTQVSTNHFEFLTKNEICLHFFNRKGWYVGSYYPRRSLN